MGVTAVANLHPSLPVHSFHSDGSHNGIMGRRLPTVRWILHDSETVVRGDC